MDVGNHVGPLDKIRTTVLDRGAGYKTKSTSAKRRKVQVIRDKKNGIGAGDTL